MRAKLKVAVIGLNGRMGQELRKLIDDSKDMSLVSQSSEQVDVVVDFSSPAGTVEAAAWCARHKIPLVSGTTGLSAQQMKKLRVAARRTAVLWSPNMSLGILHLRKMLSAMPRSKDFDYQIEEQHHSRKKDRPSGTARQLQEDLQKELGRKLPTPLSVRAGGIFGIHRILCAGPEETLVLEHVALSRAVFARGALLAARWIKNKGPGFYDFAEVL